MTDFSVNYTWIESLTSNWAMGVELSSFLIFEQNLSNKSNQFSKNNAAKLFSVSRINNRMFISLETSFFGKSYLGDNPLSLIELSDSENNKKFNIKLSIGSIIFEENSSLKQNNITINEINNLKPNNSFQLNQNEILSNKVWKINKESDSRTQETENLIKYVKYENMINIFINIRKIYK